MTTTTHPDPDPDRSGAPGWRAIVVSVSGSKRWGVAMAVLAATLLSGCAGGGNGRHPAPPSVAGGQARIADLQISDAIVPAPASPDVAAAYFTISNRGSTRIS